MGEYADDLINQAMMEDVDLCFCANCGENEVANDGDWCRYCSDMDEALGYPY